MPGLLADVDDPPAQPLDGMVVITERIREMHDEVATSSCRLKPS